MKTNQKLFTKCVLKINGPRYKFNDTFYSTNEERPVAEILFEKKH